MNELLGLLCLGLACLMGYAFGVGGAVLFCALCLFVGVVEDMYRGGDV